MTLTTEPDTEGLEIEADTTVGGYEATQRKRWPRYLAHAILIIAVFVFVSPFVWAFFTSLKPESEIFATIYQIIPSEPTAENYVQVWNEQPLDRWVMNSLIISTGIAVASLSWYGVRQRLTWAWATAIAAAVVGLALALPMHWTGDAFSHDWLTHLGPIYLATGTFVVGAVLAYRGLEAG
mgnify:CR=1 FL=1